MNSAQTAHSQRRHAPVPVLASKAKLRHLDSTRARKLLTPGSACQSWHRNERLRRCRSAHLRDSAIGADGVRVQQLLAPGRHLALVWQLGGGGGRAAPRPCQPLYGGGYLAARLHRLRAPVVQNSCKIGDIDECPGLPEGAKFQHGAWAWLAQHEEAWRGESRASWTCACCCMEHLILAQQDQWPRNQLVQEGHQPTAINVCSFSGSFRQHASGRQSSKDA